MNLLQRFHLIIRTAVLAGAIASIPLSALAENLRVSIENKIPSDVSRNILAHIGTMPETESERVSFLYGIDDHIDQAINALGYYRARITKTLDKTNDKRWNLALTVELNEPTLIRNIVVRVVGEAAEDEAFISLMAEQPIKSGDKLHQGVYEDIKSKLASLGIDRGYFLGEISTSKVALHESFAHADIEIIYDSGQRFKFGKIHFSEFDIQQSLLQKVVPFKEDEYFTTEKLYRLQSQLQRTQFFGSAIAIPDKSNMEANTVPINVDLTKAKSHYFDFGIGFATDTDFRYSVGWRTPLINRFGHRQETKIEYSKVNPKFRFIYSIPLSHPINDILQLQLTLNDEKYGDLTSIFKDYKVANQRIYQNWAMQFYARALRENWTFDGIANDVNYLLPGITISKSNSRGSQLDPSQGFSQVYGIEAGSKKMRSEIDLVRLYARWRYIYTLFPDHRIVLRGELGATYIDQEDKKYLPPSLRFFAGGDQSIRGYAYQSLGTKETITQGENAGKEIVVGGTRLAVASLEYQYYFNKTMRGILFTDMGNASDELKFKAVQSVGTGFHYISPIGPIRFDVGYTISEPDPSWRLHLTLGTEL